VAAAVFLIAAGALMLNQESLIFFPTRLPADERFSFQRPFVEKFIETRGEKIHALYFPNDRDKGVILYFHGNGGALDTWGEVAEELASFSDYGVLMVDYPGYGKSAGKISSETQLHAIADACFQEASLLAGGPKRVVIFGRSIGTGLATRLAAENPEAAALILETPYLSLRDLAAEHYPWAPLFLLKYQFRSDQFLPKISAPVLILHGTRDEVIPFEQGRRLAQLGKSVTFIEIPGGHHNDLGRYPQYRPAIREFLARRLTPPRDRGN